MSDGAKEDSVATAASVKQPGRRPRKAPSGWSGLLGKIALWLGDRAGGAIIAALLSSLLPVWKPAGLSQGLIDPLIGVAFAIAFILAAAGGFVWRTKRNSARSAAVFAAGLTSCFFLGAFLLSRDTSGLPPVRGEILKPVLQERVTSPYGNLPFCIRVIAKPRHSVEPATIRIYTDDKHAEVQIESPASVGGGTDDDGVSRFVLAVPRLSTAESVTFRVCAEGKVNVLRVEGG